MSKPLTFRLFGTGVGSALGGRLRFATVTVGAFVAAAVEVLRRVALGGRLCFATATVGVLVAAMVEVLRRVRSSLSPPPLFVPCFFAADAEPPDSLRPAPLFTHVVTFLAAALASTARNVTSLAAVVMYKMAVGASPAQLPSVDGRAAAPSFAVLELLPAFGVYGCSGFVGLGVRLLALVLLAGIAAVPDTPTTAAMSVVRAATAVVVPWAVALVPRLA